MNDNISNTEDHGKISSIIVLVLVLVLACKNDDQWEYNQVAGS